MIKRCCQRVLHGLPVFLMLGLALGALAEERTLTATELARLSASTQWHRLLHMPVGGEVSDIGSSEYFLAANGATDAQAELQATLAAWDAPWTDLPDQHPRCRFPARYHWLATQLTLPSYQVIDARCAALGKWAKLDQVQSVSLILVSGYFGNPASTFGHALLKFNTDRVLSAQGLLDTSLNFGALVPPDEPILTYVYKGLTGGYVASFADKDYYSHDLVYGSTEFRDMWEYQLALPAAQRERLVLHLWEVVGKKFGYLFLSKNCALRLAELVEAGTDEAVARSPWGWYAPVQLFNDLKLRDAEHPSHWIQTVRYLPSSERVLNTHFAELGVAEQQIARDAIVSQARLLNAQLATLSIERQQKLLDVLTAYYGYKVMAANGHPEAALREAKDRVLLQRLRLPPRTEPEAALPDRASPADGTKPGLFGVGVAHQDGQSIGLLRWSPFFYDHAGFSGLDDDELVVLDTNLRLALGGKVTLSQLDLLRARKLSTQRNDLTGGSGWSWQLAATVGQGLSRPGSHLDARIQGGLGRAWRDEGRWLSYAMLDVVAQQGRSPFWLRPHLGFGYRLQTFKLSGSIGQGMDITHGANQEDVQFTASLRLKPDVEMRAVIEHKQKTSGSVAMHFYF